MADLSNAKITPAGDAKPMNTTYYMGTNYTGYLYSSTGTVLTSSGSKQVLLETPTKVSILFTGTFASNVSGTEFYIKGRNNNMWRVYNVTFSGNDPYSFILDIDISGNT